MRTLKEKKWTYTVPQNLSIDLREATMDESEQRLHRVHDAVVPIVEWIRENVPDADWDIEDVMTQLEDVDLDDPDGMYTGSNPMNEDWEDDDEEEFDEFDYDDEEMLTNEDAVNYALELLYQICDDYDIWLPTMSGEIVMEAGYLKTDRGELRVTFVDKENLPEGAGYYFTDKEYDIYTAPIAGKDPVLFKRFYAVKKQLKEDVSDGWDEELGDSEVLDHLEKFIYEIRKARRGVHTRAHTYDELAEYTRKLATELEDFAEEIEHTSTLDESMSTLNEAVSTSDLFNALRMMKVIGIETEEDLEKFMKEDAKYPNDPLKSLYSYKIDELTPNFKAEENINKGSSMLRDLQQHLQQQIAQQQGAEVGGNELDMNTRSDFTGSYDDNI